MGLDNGIKLKLKSTDALEKFPKKFLKTVEFYEDSFRELSWDKMKIIPLEAQWTIELCYWRKCWGIRGEILSYLNNGLENETGCYDLDKNKIKGIRDIISNCNNKKWWTEDGESIWTYSEIHDRLDRQIKVLDELYQILDRNKEIETEIKEFYFYDSY